MARSFQTAAYGLSAVYPPKLESNTNILQESGLSALITGLYGVDSDGNIFLHFFRKEKFNLIFKLT